MEAAIWKTVADAAARGHLLVDLEKLTLDRTLPLALLPSTAAPLIPGPLPDTLLANVPVAEEIPVLSELGTQVPGPTFDASALPEKQREHFHRNVRAVELPPAVPDADPDRPVRVLRIRTLREDPLP